MAGDDIEVGLERSYEWYSDFKRCLKCHRGYWVNCHARRGQIQCPDCGHVQPR